MKPNGKVLDWINGHGCLAANYYGFLQSMQPVETWEQVAPLAVPTGETGQHFSHLLSQKLANRTAPTP